jgi:hypothetical protein
MGEEMRMPLIYSINPKKKDYLRNLDVDKRIILKSILNNTSDSVLIGLYGRY